MAVLVSYSNLCASVTRSHVWHDSFICIPWLIYLCAITHWIWDESFVRVTHHLCVWHDYSDVCRDSFISVIWHTHMCAVTHSYVWHESSICVPPWLVHMCDMTHSYVCRDSVNMRWISCTWHASFVCVTWLIHMCAVFHSYLWHETFRRVPCFIDMCDMTTSCVKSLIHMCDMTYSDVWLTNSYEWHDSIICAAWFIHVWHASFICVTWLIHMGTRSIHVWHAQHRCTNSHKSSTWRSRNKSDVCVCVCACQCVCVYASVCGEDTEFRI